MDPTDKACQIDETKLVLSNLDQLETPEWISPEISIKHEDEIYQTIYQEDFDMLADLKDGFDGKYFIEARNEANPYEEIQNSIFANRAGIKIANTDAVFHLTGDFSFGSPRVFDKLTFADIAAGPGAFTQYIQWRCPNSFGFGMTLKHKTLDWDFNIIDPERFEAYYGKGNKGDLYEDAEDFVSLLDSKGKVDLITSDGGFDLSNDKQKMRKQEYVSSRLFLSQVLVGVGGTKQSGNGTKKGGSFVVKLFDTNTLFSFQVIYLISQCFDKVCIFKPISSRPANAERYLVATGRNDNEYVYDILTKVHRSYDQSFVSSIFDDPLPDTFVTWIERQNKRSLDRQLSTTKLILEYMKKEPEQKAVNKFIYKVYPLWCIPGPQNPKEKKYKKHIKCV